MKTRMITAALLLSLLLTSCTSARKRDKPTCVFGVPPQTVIAPCDEKGQVRK